MALKHTINVVVSEDEPLFLSYIVKKIENYDPCFNIIATAQNGQDAYDIISKYHPHVLITDIKMPKLSGLELVEKLRATNPNLIIIIVSGFNDFDYAKKAIKLGVTDYLLKPIEDNELKQALDRAKEKIKSEFEISEKKSITLKMQGVDQYSDISQSLKTSVFGMCLINIGNYGSNMASIATVNQFADEWNKIEWNSIIGKCNNKFQNIQNIMIIDEKNSNQKFIIFILEPDFSYDIASFSNQLSAILTKILYPHCVTICLNKDLITYSDIWKTAQKLRSTLAKKLLICKSSILFDDDKTNEDIDIPKITSNLRNDLLPSITSENRKELLKTAGQLLDSWQKEQYSQYYTEQLIASMFTTITSSLYNLSSNKSNSYTHTDYNSIISEKLLSITSYEDFKEFVIKLIDQLVCENFNEADSPVAQVDKIEKYLLQNYYKNFSLEELASYFKFSSAYLTKIFKKYKNQTPLKFITEIRMKEASRLICDHSDLDFRVISEMVGYTDSHYFYRVFKEYYKATPSEYRNSIGNKPD